MCQMSIPSITILLYALVIEAELFNVESGLSDVPWIGSMQLEMVGWKTHTPSVPLKMIHFPF